MFTKPKREAIRMLAKERINKDSHRVACCSSVKKKYVEEPQNLKPMKKSKSLRHTLHDSVYVKFFKQAY